MGEEPVASSLLKGAEDGADRTEPAARQALSILEGSIKYGERPLVFVEVCIVL